MPIMILEMKRVCEGLSAMFRCCDDGHHGVVMIIVQIWQPFYVQCFRKPRRGDKDIHNRCTG